MKYCVNCRSLCEDEVCSFCGAKKLKDAEDDDFCLLFECERGEGEVLKSFLDEEGIPCVLMPSGNGLRTVLGLNLENYKVFVPYRFYDKASEIVDSISNDSTEQYRERLLEQIGLWHFKNESSEKKFRKKFDLEKGADPLAYVKEEVEQAFLITDEGIIYACPERGHFLSVKSERGNILFNSATYEIVG